LKIEEILIGKKMGLREEERGQEREEGVWKWSKHTI
jgi:hypothetical protein